MAAAARGLRATNRAAHMNTLDQWLEYQQQQHAKEIDMTLERARLVADRMRLAKPAPLVITVAGTNGKGSTVAFLQALLSAIGLRVGCYTSPHILHYQERIALPGRFANEPELLTAFQTIEQARTADASQIIGLTFFEYATLAAWHIFERAELDAVVLEVGMGGRLDTVNLIDADGVILTTVELDHQAFLGATRALIGKEKAGVFRALQTAVYADREPLTEVIEFADRLGTKLLRPKRDYFVREDRDQFRFQLHQRAELLLPKPTLAAPTQIDNAAAAIALLMSLPQTAPHLNADSIAAAMRQAHVPGRLTQVGESPAIYLDVAHNPQAAFSLAKWLHSNPIFGRTIGVYGALEDKDALGVVSELRQYVQQWYFCGLDHLTPRGLNAMALASRVRGPTGGRYESLETPALALDAAIKNAKPNDRILVFGSFYLIAECYRAFGVNELPAFVFNAIAPSTSTA
jgi:dihydrofolate synthase / folylpolyglutamate synthase